MLKTLLNYLHVLYIVTWSLLNLLITVQVNENCINRQNLVLIFSYAKSLSLLENHTFNYQRINSHQIRKCVVWAIHQIILYYNKETCLQTTSTLP